MLINRSFLYVFWSFPFSSYIQVLTTSSFVHSHCQRFLFPKTTTKATSYAQELWQNIQGKAKEKCLVFLHNFYRGNAEWQRIFFNYSYIHMYVHCVHRNQKNMMYTLYSCIWITPWSTLTCAFCTNHSSMFLKKSDKMW